MNLQQGVEHRRERGKRKYKFMKYCMNPSLFKKLIFANANQNQRKKKQKHNPSLHDQNKEERGRTA